MPFTPNHLNIERSKTFVVKVGGTVAYQKIYLPVDKDITGRLITGIEWNEGGVSIVANAIFGGTSYTLLTDTVTPNFTISLVDSSNTIVCENFVLSSLTRTFNGGKLRRFNCRIQSDKSYITNIATTFSPVAAAGIALTFFYK